jgi:hypothetical protein
LKELVLQVVAVITQTAPGAKELYEEQFKLNLAEFLLFVHFVMACLHRQSDIQSFGVVAKNTSSDLSYPFFKHRAHNDANVTNRAQERIELLRRYSESRLFSSCVPSDGETVPGYKAASEEMIRLENAKLESENASLQEKAGQLGREGKRVSEALNKAHAEIKKLSSLSFLSASLRNAYALLDEAQRDSKPLDGGLGSLSEDTKKPAARTAAPDAS